MNTPQTQTTIGETKKAEGQAKAGAESKALWLQHFSKAISTPAELAGITVPPCLPIIGKWFRQGDLGFICGPRGLGKTWLAMVMARKCAEGSGFGGLTEWQVHGARRVLYVDGEMSMDGIRERDNALAAVPTKGITYLQHEALFHLTGKVLNLTDPNAQAALLEMCREGKQDLLILDNLSCLFPGLRENDADAWDRVLPWLLDLRRNRVAVIFIAHSGRNGQMRGTSRREDAAFWIIDLAEVNDTSEGRNGAKFVTRFVKNRHATGADCPALEWTFATQPNDPKAHVSWKRVVAPERFRQCIEEGLVTASQIAEEMSMSRGQVSKYAAKAIKDGWLTKKGREYALVKVPTASQGISQFFR